MFGTVCSVGVEAELLLNKVSVPKNLFSLTSLIGLICVFWSIPLCGEAMSDEAFEDLIQNSWYNRETLYAIAQSGHPRRIDVLRALLDFQTSLAEKPLQRTWDRFKRQYGFPGDVHGDRGTVSIDP